MKRNKSKTAAPIVGAADQLFAHLAKLGIEASCGIGASQAGGGKVIAVRIANEKHMKHIPKTWDGFAVDAEWVGVIKAY